MPLKQKKNYTMLKIFIAAAVAVAALLMIGTFGAKQHLTEVVLS